MNENEKVSLEQFGAQIRLKHPEYLKYSNKEIAERTVQKYPQYKTRISDLPQEEKKKGIFRKIGDFFTSGTQRFGADIGQAFASDKEVSRISQAEQLSSDIELNLIKTIGEAKAAGKDVSKLEKELITLQGRQDVGSRMKEIVPVTGKSKKQIIGGAIETGLEALSGGIIGGIKGFGLKKLAATSLDEVAKRAAMRAAPLTTRLGGIAKDTAVDTAKLLPFGYSFDVAKNLQEDKTGASLFKPGFGSAFSLLPLAIGGVQAGRQVTADALSRGIAPNLSGVPAKAYERMRTGDATKFIGKATPESVLDDARASASAFKSAMQRSFGQGMEDSIVEFTGKRIGLDEKNSQKLTKIAERFGFEDRLPQNMRNMSVKETFDVLKEINAIGAVKQIDDPLVKSLKLSLAEIKDDIRKRAQAQFGGKGGTFDTVYKDYSVKSDKLKDIQSIIGKVGIKPNSIKLTPVQRQTVSNRLQKVFNDDADGYLQAVKAIEDETGDNILDKIAASQLSPKKPEAFRVSVSSAPKLNPFSGVGAMGLINDIYSAVTFPLSSPRMSAWLIRKIGGYDESLATRLLNAAPSVRTAIYNAVNKENMAFDDAVKLYAREYIENPRLGLSIEDVTKRKSAPRNDLTTKILKDLEGKTTVSKQYILDATNRGELKQAERDLTRQILDTMPDGQINVADFTKRVQAELLPLKIVDREMSGGGGTRNIGRYENVVLPDEIRGDVESYGEHLYNSPIKTSAGEVHFSGTKGSENYFGHTRIEDMADNKTRRVIEVQSDLYQKGNLEREQLPALRGKPSDYLTPAETKRYDDYMYEGKRNLPKEKVDDFVALEKKVTEAKKAESAARNQELSKLAQYSNPTAHFRMVREELKKAAQDGKTKLQFPTGETAMKIEGLSQTDTWFKPNLDASSNENWLKLTPEDLKVGEIVSDRSYDDWIITRVDKDGKFQAVPRDTFENVAEESGKYPSPDDAIEALKRDAFPKSDLQSDFESFDISGKVDTNNPIYKFYEKDLRKYLAKFGSNRVVDANGVSWIEVPIKKEYGTNPVEAFGKIGINPLTIGAASTALGVLLGKQKGEKEVEKQ